MNILEEILVYGVVAVLALSILIIAIIAGVYWLIWYFLARPIENILKDKYAKGELSKEDYYDLKKNYWWHHGRF